MKSRSKVKGQDRPSPKVRESGAGRTTKYTAKGSGTIKKSDPGPRIVRAWFDTVINPLISGLRVEHEYAKQKNWTWRRGNEYFEVLCPVEVHVGGEMRDNLRQFIQLNSEVRSVVEEHEESLEELAGKCNELKKMIFSSSLLQRTYRKATSEESLRELGVSLEEMFGNYPDKDRLGLLTQYIINRTPPLPDYYSAHQLWNKWRAEFLKILDQKDVRPYTRQMDDAGARLLRAIVRLSEELEKVRLRLSLQHDVPYRLAADQPRRSDREMR